MTRILVILVLALGVATPAVAAAQAAPTPTVRVQPKESAVKVSPHMDRYESPAGQQHWGIALMFWAFALITVGGALFVVTRRNLIAAVMGMVGSFLGIAAVYMMLYASFLAVIQMLVYAGAIMVLFVFVIMVLNRPEDEPVAPTGRLGQILGGVAIVYLVGRLIMLLVDVRPPNPATAIAAPSPTVVQTGPTSTELVQWGSVKSVGGDLFGPGLFPFEAISILLLIAVVGAIAVARPMHSDDPEVTP
jgi:NADH-quinone oxidoreductase subunit J